MSRMKTPAAGIKFLYGVYKNNNSKNPAAFGKYYGKAAILSTLDTDDVAEHMQEHGCLYGSDVIKGVLEKFYDCAVELLFQNRRIKVGGLGTLYMGLVTEGAERESDFDPTYIKAVKIGLIPDAKQDQQLSGPQLRQRMHFTNKTSSYFVYLNGFDESEGGGSDDQEPED